MKFDSLRGFIEGLEGIGELQRVEGAHWDLEIGAITELNGERNGPALLFDRIGDYPPGYRVLCNSLSSLKRTALVLGLQGDSKPMQMLREWRERLRDFSPIPSIEVKEGPVKQNVHTGTEVDLFEFPAPKWHELDGGRYLGTGGGVITRDPEEGWVNVGTYRCEIIDKDHIFVKLNKGRHGRMMVDKYHAQGQACPVAISFGHDPALFIASSHTGVPWGVSEYDFTGWLKGEPVRVVKGEVTDLPIPATAELVIEGEIPPLKGGEPGKEGRFGEWTGYYAGTKGVVVPVMTVKSIFHRDDPIILGQPPLKPPNIHRCALPLIAASIWDEIENAGIQGVKAVWVPVFEYAAIVVVSIKQLYAGHAKQAAFAAASCGSANLIGRFIVVVDDDVDITNLGELLWAVVTRCDAETIDIMRGIRTATNDPLLPIESRARGDLVRSRAIIDACRPYTWINEFPPVNIFSPEYREKTMNKWRQQLFTGLRSETEHEGGG